jgi:hypothetical protein
MKYAHIAILSLAATTALTATLPAQAQQSTGNIDLVSAGVSVLNTIINPPHRSAEIQAEADIKKAKINAQMELDKEKLRIEASKSSDPATTVLTAWGANRITCTPGAVFVNGITNDTVCINPTASIPSGYYNYTSGKNQLVRVNTGDGNTAPSQPSGEVQTASRRNTSNRSQTTATNTVRVTTNSSGF